MHSKSLQPCSTLCNPMDWSLPGFSVHGDSPGNNTRVGYHALLQGIFLTQGSNLGLLWLLYHWATGEAHGQAIPLLGIYPVQSSHSVMSDSLRPNGLQLARPPYLSPTPRVYSNSSLLSQWCHPTISSSVIPFSSCFQSFPASGSFQMSQFFAFRWPSIQVTASASVFPMNIQDWFPLEWIVLISFQAKGLSRVFSNTTVQKHQLFITHLSL